MMTPAVDSKPFSKRVIAAWALFDFAQSAYSIIIITFIFPIYFGDVIVQNGRGDFYWGIAMSLSMLIVALLAPALGAMADFTGQKKRFLGVFASVCILGTISLYFLQPGMLLAGIALFVLANAGFEGGMVFYDAFLPEITSQRTYGRVSGIGFASGYAGCVAVLILTKFLVTHEPPLIRESFLVAGGFFALFSLPLFFTVPEKRIKRSMRLLEIVRHGFKQNIATIRKIREHREVARFLLAFFVYNDAILTVIGFSGRYAKNSLHFSTPELAYFFLIVLTVAIVGSLVFGFVTDRTGPRFTILLTLSIWIAVVLGAYFATSKESFYIVGAFAGLVLGASQSASRGLMAAITPKEHTGEFFGFYDGFCGKASAVIGPIIYGVLSDLFGQRPAIISTALFFIIGILLVKGLSKSTGRATLAQ